MRALTIHQPWASLVALGVKTIETRSWRTSYRGPLAIHAGQRSPSTERSVKVGDWCMFYGRRRWEIEHFAAGEHGAPSSLQPPFGAVVATATLVDCVPICGWGEDPPCDHLCVGRDGRLRAWGYCPDGDRRAWRPLTSPDRSEVRIDDRTDQLPYGDFTPGRWAWLLADVQPIGPIPAKGRQGLWECDLAECGAPR